MEGGSERMTQRERAVGLAVVRMNGCAGGWANVGIGGVLMVIVLTGEGVGVTSLGRLGR